LGAVHEVGDKWEFEQGAMKGLSIADNSGTPYLEVYDGKLEVDKSSINELDALDFIRTPNLKYTNGDTTHTTVSLGAQNSVTPASGFYMIKTTTYVRYHLDDWNTGHNNGIHGLYFFNGGATLKNHGLAGIATIELSRLDFFG